MFSHLDWLSDQDFDHTENEKMVNNFSFLWDNKELLECFLHLPDANNMPFALDLAQINCTMTTTRPRIVATMLCSSNKIS
jgi:hypothetical protein